MSTQIPPKQIDDLIDVYVDWREACLALNDAYERWSSVRVAERESAFAEYRAALNCEEEASAAYADRLNRATHALQSAPHGVGAR
jgi:hypothetical protein